MRRFNFPARPLVLSVTDLAGEAEKAFINLMPFPVEIRNARDEWRTVEFPALFISDGMSIPDVIQSKMQGEDGIVAGHVHDMLYSPATNLASLVASAYNNGGSGELPRGVADEVLKEYLLAHCPGFRTIEAAEARLAVRVFGGRHFHNTAADDWRRKVAARLQLPRGDGMDGCGCMPPTGATTEWIAGVCRALARR